MASVGLVFFLRVNGLLRGVAVARHARSRRKSPRGDVVNVRGNSDLKKNRYTPSLRNYIRCSENIEGNSLTH
jgi:hypothetical protein